MRRMTPSEIRLESVKASIRSQQQERTVSRVAELRAEAEWGLHSGKSRKSVDVNHQKSESASMSREYENRSASDRGRDQRLNGRAESSSAVPSTIARKNITTRRSKGRETKSMSDPKELVAKKSKRRSRDRRYTLESGEEAVSRF
jgi:hypothetical protein